MNPRRRIRQHNGEIGCGAWRTKKRRPWEMVLCIYGFPTNVSALQVPLFFFYEFLFCYSFSSVYFNILDFNSIGLKEDRLSLYPLLIDCIFSSYECSLLVFTKWVLYIF